MLSVLTGDNAYGIAETVAEIAADFVGEVEKYDGTELETKNLPDIFMGVTLFSSERLVVITGMASNKPLYADLDQWIPRIPESTHIVLIDENPDKRTRTYKQLQKHATIRHHSSVGEGELVSWLRGLLRESETDVPSDVVRYFVQYVGYDQWRLRSELDKLLLSNKPLTRELIRDISEPYPEASAFELLDSVFAGNVDRAGQLLSSLREHEDPYLFFGLLSSQVAALLALVSAGSRRPDEVARDMGLHPFVVKKLAPLATRLGPARVKVLVAKLAYCDTRIKTSGVNPWDQIARTLMSVTI